MLKIENLSFAYSGQETAYRFDLAVKPGEIAAISGASGAGKSTLLDLVAGFSAPQSGKITCDGLDITHLPPEQRPVSILFQADNLFEHLTISKNLALGLPRTTPKNALRERIGEALSNVGLAGLEDRRAANLSGGQKQRVALARTLLRNHPILLLDEPFSAIDEATAETMRALVRDLTRQHQWRVLVVSHNQKDIKTLADKTYTIADLTLVAA